VGNVQCLTSNSDTKIVCVEYRLLQNFCSRLRNWMWLKLQGWLIHGSQVSRWMWSKLQQQQLSDYIIVIPSVCASRHFQLPTSKVSYKILLDTLCTDVVQKHTIDANKHGDTISGLTDMQELWHFIKITHSVLVHCWQRRFFFNCGSNNGETVANRRMPIIIAAFTAVQKASAVHGDTLWWRKNGLGATLSRTLGAWPERRWTKNVSQRGVRFGTEDVKQWGVRFGGVISWSWIT